MSLVDVLKKRDLAYVAPIAGISLSKIGELLSYGAHHRFYAYGRKQVIKIPIARFAFLYSTSSHLEQDLRLLQRYCPQLVVPTEIYATPRHTRHCVVQQRVVGQHATVQALRSHHLAVASLLRSSDLLMKNHRCAIDSVGGEGVLSCLRAFFGSVPEPYCSNLFLVKGKLVLLDCELLRFSYRHYSVAELIRCVLSYVTHAVNRLCWRYFFKVWRFYLIRWIGCLKCGLVAPSNHLSILDGSIRTFPLLRQLVGCPPGFHFVQSRRRWQDSNPWSREAHAFQACAIDHYATPPYICSLRTMKLYQKNADSFMTSLVFLGK